MEGLELSHSHLVTLTICSCEILFVFCTIQGDNTPLTVSPVNFGDYNTVRLKVQLNIFSNCELSVFKKHTTGNLTYWPRKHIPVIWVICAQLECSLLTLLLLASSTHVHIGHTFQNAGCCSAQRT